MKPTRASVDTIPGQINWLCFTCQQPATAGAVHIDLQQVRITEKAIRDWERSKSGVDVPVLQLGDLFRMPSLAHWRVDCDACRHSCGGCYMIDLTRCQSAYALIKWTEHLYGKSWFAATDWVHFIAGVARASGSPSEATGVW